MSHDPALDDLDAIKASIATLAGGGAAAAATGTQSSVSDAAASTTILAANANRLGAAFFNDSPSILYLLLGAGTASTTVYTAQIPAFGYYDLPLMKNGVYTGIIKGIWSADASGAVRVTEFT